MKMTRHSLLRMRQRGLSSLCLDIILKYGHISNAPNGATRIMFNNKEYQLTIEELKLTMKLMEKAKNGNIVIMNDHIVTVYKKS